MTARPVSAKRLFGDLTAPGRASFDWAVLCAATALLVPATAVLGLILAERCRRQGYRRWKAVFLINLWCALLGVLIRGLVHMEVLP